jgi:hypothetical protein
LPLSDLLLDQVADTAGRMLEDRLDELAIVDLGQALAAPR